MDVGYAAPGDIILPPFSVGGPLFLFAGVSVNVNEEEGEVEGEGEGEESKDSYGNELCSGQPFFCEEFTTIFRFLLVRDDCDVLRLPDAFCVSQLLATI